MLDANDDLGIEAVRKLMDFYQSCMNTEKINSLGGEPLLKVINDNGEWICKWIDIGNWVKGLPEE